MDNKQPAQTGQKVTNEAGGAYKPLLAFSRRVTRRVTADLEEAVAEALAQYQNYCAECFGFVPERAAVMEKMLSGFMRRDRDFQRWQKDRLTARTTAPAQAESKLEKRSDSNTGQRQEHLPETRPMA